MIIYAAYRASGRNTPSAASGAWSFSRGFQRVLVITSASSKRSWQLSAGHRVNVPAKPVATSRETQISRNCQCFGVNVAVQAAAVSRILAPVVVTLAKISHMRRTGGSRWIHRPCPCSTIRFRSAGLAHYTRATCWVSVVRARQKELVSENVIIFQKFSIVMPPQSLDRDRQLRHAEAKAGHNFWCRAKRCLASPNNMPVIGWRFQPRAHATHHGRDARRTCCREHPACPCTVLYCKCTMWISSRQCQPCRQYRPRTPQRVRFFFFQNIPTVGVSHTHFQSFEGCVNAILRWTRQVVFLRRCHVQSHREGIITCTVMRCDSAVSFCWAATFVCTSVASLCAPVSHTVLI